MEPDDPSEDDAGPREEQRHPAEPRQGRRWQLQDPADRRDDDDPEQAADDGTHQQAEDGAVLSLVQSFSAFLMAAPIFSTTSAEWEPRPMPKVMSSSSPALHASRRSHAAAA